MDLPSREEVRSWPKEQGFRVGYYLCAVTKMGGSRIYKTDCRALLIKLGLGKENTSVRVKSVVNE